MRANLIVVALIIVLVFIGIEEAEGKAIHNNPHFRPEHCPYWVEMVRSVIEMNDRQKQQLMRLLHDYRRSGKMGEMHFKKAIQAYSYVQSGGTLEGAKRNCPGI